MTTLIDILAVSLVPEGSSILLQSSKQSVQRDSLPYKPYIRIALELYI